MSLRTRTTMMKPKHANNTSITLQYSPLMKDTFNIGVKFIIFSTRLICLVMPNISLVGGKFPNLKSLCTLILF